MDAYLRPSAMALRVVFGLALGMLGIFLFGVAGANAAGPPIGHQAQNSSHGSSDRSTPAQTHTERPRPVQRALRTHTVDKVTRGTVSGVADTLERTAAKARTSHGATEIPRRSATQDSSAPNAPKAPAASTPRKSALQKHAVEAAQAARTAADSGVKKTAGAVHAQKATHQVRATADQTVRALTKATKPTTSSKAADQRERPTASAGNREVHKSATQVAAQKASAKEKEGERTRRQAVSPTTRTDGQRAKRAAPGDSGILLEEPVQTTVEAVTDLPATIAEPSVKATLSTATSVVDDTTAQIPVVKSLVPTKMANRATKPAVDLAGGTVDGVVAPVTKATQPVLEPAGDAMKPVADIVDDTTRPVLHLVVGTVDEVTGPVVRPVEQLVQPVADPLGATLKPVLATVADTVDPVVEPVAGVINPIAGTAAAVLETALPETGVVPTRTAVGTTNSDGAAQPEARSIALATQPSATSSTLSIADRLKAAQRADDPFEGSAGAEVHTTFAITPGDMTTVADTNGLAGAASNSGDTHTPRPTPAPLAAQGAGASFGNGSGPLTPAGAVQGTPFTFVPNTVSEPTSETIHQGPRGSANDPGSTPG